MKFIERVFDLAPVTHRDATASDLMGALNTNINSQYAADSFSMQGTPRSRTWPPHLPSMRTRTAPAVSFGYLNNRTTHRTRSSMRR